jgi:hypothetical protein
MFRATHRSSLRAQNCNCSLWFYICLCLPAAVMAERELISEFPLIHDISVLLCRRKFPGFKAVEIWMNCAVMNASEKKFSPLPMIELLPDSSKSLSKLSEKVPAILHRTDTLSEDYFCTCLTSNFFLSTMSTVSNNWTIRYYCRPTDNCNCLTLIRQ